MKKVFTFALFCLVCTGCQSGGQGWPGSALSTGPSAARGTASTNLASTEGAAATGTTATAAATTAPGANATAANAGHAAPATTATSGERASALSTMGKIWRAISFQQPDAETPPATSPEVARFNAFVTSISNQTSQLNINDPPEVTRQKAQAILATLGDWDSVLAAGRSVGVINDATAELITTSVQRLKAETEKLVKYAPHPQTIEAVKQLGGSLGAAYQGVQGILAQGANLTQAFQGQTAQ